MTKPDIEKARAALAAKRAKDGNRASFRALVAGAFALCLWFAYSAITAPEPPPPAPATSTACDNFDAQCVAARISSGVQGPCSRAVESLLAFKPEWTDGLLTSRFDRAMWYEPGQTLIFHGRELKATNAFGATLSPGYFCITSTTGTVIRAGIPDLQGN